MLFLRSCGKILGGLSGATRPSQSSSSQRPSTVKPTQPPAEDPVPAVDYGFYGAALPEEQKRIYAYLVAGIDGLQTEIELKNVSGETAATVLFTVCLDRPDFYWLTTAASWKTVDGVLLFTPESMLPLEQLQQERAGIRAQVAELAAATQGLSDYETALCFHDWIITNTVYDHALAERGDNSYEAESGTAYGVFHNRLAVCSGYARAFQWLMHERGLACATVIGEAYKTDLPSPSHEWNLAKLDGEWYHVDLTFDDVETPEGEGYLTHSYFCLTTEEILCTRSIGEMPGPVPTCTATALNYHRKNGLYLEAYNAEQIRDILLSQKAVAGTLFTMRFATAEACGKAYDALVTKENFFSITGHRGRILSSITDDGCVLNILVG